MGTLLRSLLNNPALRLLVGKEIKRAHRQATRPLPGGTGSSFKQNRRRELKATARRQQRHLHKNARRSR